jgi:hypothetical protein
MYLERGNNSDFSSIGQAITVPIAAADGTITQVRIIRGGDY